MVVGDHGQQVGETLVAGRGSEDELQTMSVLLIEVPAARGDIGPAVDAGPRGDGGDPEVGHCSTALWLEVVIGDFNIVAGEEGADVRFDAIDGGVASAVGIEHGRDLAMCHRPQDQDYLGLTAQERSPPGRGPIRRRIEARRP